MDEIKVGDRVRSFDFPGFRTDCYMEGTVVYIGSLFKQGEHCVAFDCDRYALQVERCVSEGKEVSFAGKYVFPPVNGVTKMFGGQCNGVEKLGM